MKALRIMQLAVLFGAAILGGALGRYASSQPQQERPLVRGALHQRGRVAPKNGKMLRDLSAKRHGNELKRMYRAITPPAKWDSATKGWISPIQDQGQCGSCWDFSGTRVVDTAYNVAGIAPSAGTWLFSEQYTLDCGRNGGCGGDDNTSVLQWAKDTGLPTQQDYGPYQARAQSCHYRTQTTLYKVDDWGYCDPSAQDGITPASMIKSAIMLYGGVGCAVAAGQGWDNYNGGVYQGSGNRSIDHDVFIRGWDDTMSPTPGKTVWIMDNSWGTSWGDKGSMYILEEADLIGTEGVWAKVNNPTPPPPPPVPPPGPTPPPMPGGYWSGTITYDNGMIQTITPKAR